jgi:hypothetical protein
MFPLIQTAAAIIGAGFLFVTGVVVTDNFISPEEIPSEVIVPTEEIEPEPPLETVEDNTATTSLPGEDIATTTAELVAEAPVIEEVPSLGAATLLEPEILPNSTQAEDSSIILATSTIETTATTTVTTEVEISEESLEIDEESDCFSGDAREVYANPGMCLRELRAGL